MNSLSTTGVIDSSINKNPWKIRKTLLAVIIVTFQVWTVPLLGRVVTWTMTLSLPLGIELMGAGSAAGHLRISGNMARISYKRYCVFVPARLERDFQCQGIETIVCTVTVWCLDALIEVYVTLCSESPFHFRWMTRRLLSGWNTAISRFIWHQAWYHILITSSLITCPLIIIYASS